MASVTDFPARARVLAVQDGIITLNPLGTNYELKLELAPAGSSGAMTPAVGQLVEGTIRVRARKVWTVPSGGNFIAPIFGPPRTIQGRIRAVDAGAMVIHAGVPIVVSLPVDKEVFDLVNGALAVYSLANVTALPGATFEILAKPDASATREVAVVTPTAVV